MASDKKFSIQLTSSESEQLIQAIDDRLSVLDKMFANLIKKKLKDAADSVAGYVAALRATRDRIINEHNAKQ